MIVRRCFTLATVFIVLTLLLGLDGIAAERWSRQVSNSEWIPLANPRTALGQVAQSNVGSGTHLSNPIQSLSLPPALQQQYQDQLIQLQKTQDSIQKLLLLQQQLKVQQQLLESQTFLPSGFSNAEDEKQALPPGSLSNLPTAPELAPEVLVSPHPSSETLPPIYPSQNFLPQRTSQPHQPSHHNQNLNQELQSLPVQGQVGLQHAEDVNEDGYVIKHEGQRVGDGKRLKGQLNSELQQPVLIENIGDEEEEVQLVYVPAETLTQRGQPKRGRGRKPYSVRQQHRENQGNIEQTSLSPDQEAFARQVLQQIQKEHEEKAQFLKEERVKEFARLNEEQKALERKTRLQQEALQREQELLRQKEAEKKRKELERLEEMARQRELERIREAREKQRQEELERRRLAELRAKEEKRREEEARQREERQKQLELEQQRILESQQEDQLRATSPSLLHQNSQSQALIREQARRQHPADVRPKKIRGRQRQRVNQYQEQANYHEITTTPSPNQPPLSVYMGSSNSKLETVKVTDVLRILRDAKTIAVLDNVGPNSPQVFVGPSNLDPPYGYAKFDLPYLSSIDHNRVERKVDKLPFFVAPLSFDPPPGYSKIPFPAPHIGSVVVNTLSDTTSEPGTPTNEQNPSPTPLIEPNSYSDADQSGSIATTASYETSTTQNFPPESSGPKYESATPSSGSRFRFRQFYDNKPTSVVSTSYYGESTAKTKSKQYYEQESKLTTQPPKVDTTISYKQDASYANTPSFQDRPAESLDPSTKEQDLAAQLALINQELAQQREAQRYNNAEQYHSQANLGESYDINDVRAPVGLSQYNLPAELPPISPHLPGLVNSLLDKQGRTVASTSTTTTTPTVTTARISSTTYRPRGRSRIVPTRPKTTQAPGSRTTADRNRRPYNRSKSRFTTTTEEYHESSYEPTKAKTPETTQKYSVEHRRPTSRTHKYRSRDRTSSQSTTHEQNQNVQAQQAAGYENYPTQSDSQGNTSPDAYSPPSGPASSLHPKETTGMSDYTRENYPLTTPTQTENYPPSLREMTVHQQSAPLVSDYDYSRSQNYPQNRPQDTRYHDRATYDQNGGFEQASTLERAPVNGFNYQVGKEESPEQAIPQRSKEYSRYQEKLEDVNYNLASTEDPRIRPGEEHQYSSIYEVNVAQAQQDYNAAGQNTFRNAEDGKIESGALETDPNASPIFVPLQQNKQEDYELQIPSTEVSLTEITTTSTTPAPVIIRQRVRGRLGGRPHHDSAIQTRPRGSQDEYVRFSAVNHDSARSTSQRHGSRTRTRVRPQSHAGSHVQTEGNEYIKIHATQHQKLIATTIPPTTTTIATTTPQPVEEDVDYGFIRPPGFRPVHPVQPVHPVDNRFQAPITYRPALSEIQHIISNTESGAESSPTQILKNRLKYNQTPSRRPATKIFTTSTTTEAVPVATEMPEETVYTVKPKTRPEDLKPTRIRGRIRRPGKKRTTTTTESALEANNELPLDENYPRITPQQLPVTGTVQQQQQPLYDDNFDVSPQFVPSQNRPSQYYEETGENYPPQEHPLVLNFGNPEQVPQREEYDQTQLASTSSKKYHLSRVNSLTSSHSTGDIYGAESQWSTKLSKTSFQPSFANQVSDESKRERGRTHNQDEKAPEIITVGPEESSVTVVVSSDYQKHADADVDMIMDTTIFGRKTNAQDHTERMSSTTAATSALTTMLQDKTRDDKEASLEAQSWMRNKEVKFTEQMDDIAKTTKKITDPIRKNGTRRRRVRVRVRPAMDDFVTAESQHFNSAVNSLVQDQYKYNPIRESRFTTAQPTTMITTTISSVMETTKKSLLQDFLEEMLKNDEVSIPTRVTSITTELPDWTISTPMTTTYVISDDNSEITTLEGSYTPIVTTPIPNADKESTAKTNDSLIESEKESKNVMSPHREQTSRLSQEKIKEQKEERHWDKNSREETVDQNNLENVEMPSQRYKLPSSYPDGSGTSKEIEDTIAELTGFPAAQQEIRKLSAIEKEQKHIMKLKKQEDDVKENDAHPKNHKPKWSEVRYPSVFDKPQTTPKPQLATSIPGVVTKNEGNASVKTLSDYVKAIFDSMKSADAEEEEEEVVAKVVEAKNESSADNSEFNDVASVREVTAKEIGKVEQKTAAVAFTQEPSTTQLVKIEESATNLAEAQSLTEMTTKESATTFETTTPIQDITTNTVIPSEETEPPATTSIMKTTTSIRRTANDAANSTETMLGKVLRTSTTTRVSHMTEICYRGRCVMTKPKMEDTTR